MKISKILFLSSIFALGSTTGYSETQAAVQPSDAAAQFTGLSLGLNGGFIHAAADTTFTYYFTPAKDFGGGRETTSANGGYAGVHAILGKVYPSKFYLGGEVTAAYNFLRGTSREAAVSGRQIRYGIRDSYTAAARVGMLAGEALVYVKGGVAFTRRVTESQYLMGNLGNTVVKTNKYKTGALAGFGFDMPVQKRVSLGLEANYVKYGPDSFVHPNMQKYTMRVDTYDFKLKVTFKM